MWWWNQTNLTSQRPRDNCSLSGSLGWIWPIATLGPFLWFDLRLGFGLGGRCRCCSFLPHPAAALRLGRLRSLWENWPGHVEQAAGAVKNEGCAIHIKRWKWKRLAFLRGTGSVKQKTYRMDGAPHPSFEAQCRHCPEIMRGRMRCINKMGLARTPAFQLLHRKALSNFLPTWELP